MNSFALWRLYISRFYVRLVNESCSSRAEWHWYLNFVSVQYQSKFRPFYLTLLLYAIYACIPFKQKVTNKDKETPLTTTTTKRVIDKARVSTLCWANPPKVTNLKFDENICGNGYFTSIVYISICWTSNEFYTAFRFRGQFFFFVRLKNNYNFHKIQIRWWKTRERRRKTGFPLWLTCVSRSFNRNNI